VNFIKNSFTYDDLLLEPRLFNGKSRKDIDLSTEICGNKLRTPIIAAPMDTVVDPYVLITMSENGGMGIIHRFCDYQKILKQLAWEGIYRMMPVGLISEQEVLEQVNNVKPEGLLIEVAHAHQTTVLKLARFIKDEFPNIPLMVGNIASTRAALDFAEIGVDAVKIGVGPSPVCSTRSVTGCGVPQAFAVAEIYGALARNWKYTYNMPQIVADGGIKSSGDIVKALALGADAVMIGSLLAQAKDGPGETIEIDGITYKTYRGMASEDVMKNRGIKRAAEGVTSKVKVTKTLSEIMSDLTDGIQSGLSYLGFNSLQELKANRDSIFAHIITNGARAENATI
jgi:IMP dehydrogenase